MITHPQIDWRGDTPVARDYGDIYYSPDNAMGEVRHNFVSCVAPMFGNREIILIGETGFGTGLNFLVTWHDWLKQRRADDRLIFISTEAHPLRRDDLKRALKPFSVLAPLAQQMIDVWPVGIPGPHRRFFDGGRVELWVHYGDALAELTLQNFQADAWYFDGFNPSENPGLWSPELMVECARLMAPGATAGTFTVAGAVRRALNEAGLEFEKRAGFGSKRECLQIYKPGKFERKNLKEIAEYRIIGDGIAAAGIANAARERSLPIYAPFYVKGFRGSHPHSASNNPAALVNFRPSKASYTPMSRWLAASLAHVQPIYDDLWLPGRGTYKPAKTEKQENEFKLALETMGWSQECLTWSEDGLMSPISGYVDPRQVRQKLFGPEEFLSLMLSDDIPHLEIFANAFGVIDAAPSLEPVLRRNLGQVDVFDAQDCTALDMPITFGGYMTPVFGGKILAGSTYDRSPDWDDPQDLLPSKSATDEIVEKATLADLVLGLTAQESFVSARAFGKDHLPIVGKTSEGAWVLTGLGSRGFLTAPLLAEILLDEMEGRAEAGLPTYDFKDCVHPSRFKA